jgi:FeS assembly SUF system regulator
MFRLTRLTDYGMVLLTSVARDPRGRARSARDLAGETRLPRPTASKILKKLARHGVLETRRGAKGGFTLARPPREIPVAEIIAALEGPVGLTVCSTRRERCGLEGVCGARSPWMRVNRAVFDALSGITLADMIRPLRAPRAAARRAP